MDPYIFFISVSWFCLIRDHRRVIEYVANAGSLPDFANLVNLKTLYAVTIHNVVRI